MNASEAVTWIAFRGVDADPRPPVGDGKLVPIGWTPEETLDLLLLLEGRTAAHPYCHVALRAPGEDWRGPPEAARYRRRALSPHGPALLRAVRAHARRVQARTVSYAELRVQLLEVVNRDMVTVRRLNVAHAALLGAMRAEKIVGWGQPSDAKGRGREPVPDDEAISLGAVAPSEVTLDVQHGRLGRPRHVRARCYFGVWFKTSEVLALWPPEGTPPAAVPEAEPEAPSPVRTMSRGGRPPKYDWPAFTRELVRTANLDSFDTRLEMATHMREWVAKNWEQQPDETTLQKKLAELYPDDLPER